MIRNVAVMMSDPPFVDILLATYNGGKYLEAQLKSLLDQTHTHWRLIVRDDGSSDNTMDILEDFAKNHPEKMFMVHDAKGSLKAMHNFSELIGYSQANYTMFCDQDDVWLPDKIELSLQRLQALESQYPAQPCLVYTDLNVVNEQLQTIHDSMWQLTRVVPTRDQKWNRLLTFNPATGCTIIFNQALRQILRPIPAGAVMHDWWLALAACFFGQLDFLPRATVLYRQHQNNTVGASQPKRKKPLEYFNQETLSTMRQQFRQAQLQAKAFADVYAQHLDKRKRHILNTFAHLELDDFLPSRMFLLKHDIVKRDLATSIAFLLRV